MSGVSIAGAGVGVFVDATGSGFFTNDMLIRGDTAVTGCATGISVLGAGASASIISNSASITGNAVGVSVDAGAALLENNDLAGNTLAAVLATNNATVDAGDCSGSDVTRLGTGTGAHGSSAGGNDLSGYGFAGPGSS